MAKIFWSRGNEIHVQDGFAVGNDLTCEEGGVWGTYCPLSDEEHVRAGYSRIEKAEAEAMASRAGYEEV